MAAKDRLRFWLVGVTVFIGFVGLLNSKLIHGAPSPEVRHAVKHLSKRDLTNTIVENTKVKNATGKASVYSGFVQQQPPPPQEALYNRNSEPSAKCPLASPSLHPCTCRSLAKGIVVECTKPQNRNELTNALAALRTYVMSEAKLTELDFEIMNSDLDQMQFMSLQFSKGNVQIKGDKNTFSLSHLEKTKTALMSVHFVNCKIDLGDTTLSRAPSVLNALEFFEASFHGEFREHWFKDLRVHQLRIMDSKEIRYPIASLLLGLQVYQHSKCGLTSISRDLLPADTSQLERLDFSNNELETLPYSIFEGIPTLKEVLLTSNRFTTLEESVFRPVLSYMRKVDVNGNFNLKCSGLEWLRDKPHEERVKITGTCINEFGLEIDLEELL